MKRWMKFWMFYLVNHPFSLIDGSAPGSRVTIVLPSPGVTAPSFSDFAADFADLADLPP
jgi:hypothetical protein